MMGYVQQAGRPVLWASQKQQQQQQQPPIAVQQMAHPIVAVGQSGGAASKPAAAAAAAGSSSCCGCSCAAINLAGRGEQDREEEKTEQREPAALPRQEATRKECSQGSQVHWQGPRPLLLQLLLPRLSHHRAASQQPLRASWQGRPAEGSSWREDYTQCDF